MKHTRLDQLSDGIFAIVMTILVFEIRIPEGVMIVSNNHLWAVLKNLAPYFGAYLLSFALLYTYWRAHHFFVSIYAKNVDSTLSNFNALFFFLIALIPFSTSVLGRFSETQLAVAVFAINVILIGMTLYSMRNYILYSEHIKNPEIATREIHGSTVRTLAPVIFALIAIPLSFLSTGYALTVLTLAVIFNLSSSSTRMFEKIFGYK